MIKSKLFLVLLLFVHVGLFAQNVSLDQAVQTSTQAIETRLPKGAKTAVLTFTATSQAFSNYIIDEIATALSASRNIQVIDRQHTDTIRKEFNIQFSGDVSDDEVKRIGHQLGAQYVITGSLVDIGNAYRFRVAAINIETAVREGSSSLNININDPQVVFLLTGQRTSQPSSTSANTENPFVGRWQAIAKTGEDVNVICILNIKADGNITVERYDTYTCTRRWTRNDRDYTSSYSYSRNGTGTGTYTALTKTGNDIMQTTISLNLTSTTAGSLSFSVQYTLNLQNPISFSRVDKSNYFYSCLMINIDYKGNTEGRYWATAYGNFNKLQ
jgi:TolB-like protein